MNQEDHNNIMQQQYIENLKNQILAKILTKEALERLGRVKLANAQLAAQVEMYLIQISQTGKITDKITDAKLKEVLKTLNEPKRDFKMRRK